MRFLRARPDWLKELQALLILVLVAAPVLIAFQVAYTLSNQLVGPEVPASMLEGVAGATGGLRPGAEVAADSWVPVAVSDPSTGQLVGWLLTGLPSTLVHVTVLVLLLRLVAAARRSDPFQPATVTRLRVLGLVTLVGVLVASFIEALAQFHLSETVVEAGMALQYQLPVAGVLVGVAFLALGEIIRRGCAMRDELAEVI